MIEAARLADVSHSPARGHCCKTELVNYTRYSVNSTLTLLLPAAGTGKAASSQAWCSSQHWPWPTSAVRGSDAGIKQRASCAVEPLAQLISSSQQPDVLQDAAMALADIFGGNSEGISQRAARAAAPLEQLISSSQHPDVLVWIGGRRCRSIKLPAAGE